MKIIIEVDFFMDNIIFLFDIFMSVNISLHFLERLSLLMLLVWQ